jgi:hypothetical protein
MSTYPGQEMFAAGIGLRRHMFNFQHTIMRWNFEIIPGCIRRSLLLTDGRITAAEAGPWDWISSHADSGG